MTTLTKKSVRTRKPVRSSARVKGGNPHGIKAVPGNPFIGLEHLIGVVALPKRTRTAREIIRERIRADHNT